ncbi:chromosome segregation protein SMC [Acidaminobacter hydrogenoformans]|uniref:Chromosome partition protein Smc n=1 Tax=Acidaminobacter hydrogenoformans DSM 2784 TaxID=1120920 RepID=A0A1G5RT37_9FIRM|nr:chromosome segregation protein SMC [Acidaminobacter hydrogenoformans]SCZ76910.1 condensin subunit Smc [Acidaminobacter hydrogenoformans DSM 2784]
MYLKKIELKGFKSFADRTTIDLMQGLTCVVGPNGSGKSNITDAIRWVLGEQKVKTLRGAKMEDVIFNGTHRRSALGVAEVSLHFSNEDRRFPIDFSEIVLARRLYRSGESEYLINDAPCRLKDVRELFMDTGVGTEGYSLIGQGRIDSIISGSSEDRRMIFEEAAGIVKYKQKKREALKKLDNTELNLMRLEDLSMDLKSRLGPLEQESEKAKTFVSLSEALREIEVAVFLADYDKLTVKLDKVIGEYDRISEEKEAEEQALTGNKERLATLEETLNSMEQHWQSLEDDRLKFNNEDKALDGDLALWDEKLRNAELEYGRLQETLDQEKGEQTALEVEGRALAEAELQVTEKLASLRAVLNERQAAMEALARTLTELETVESGARSEAIALISKSERAASEIRVKRDYIGHLEERIESLTQEASSAGAQLGAVSQRLRETAGLKEQALKRRNALMGKVEVQAAERQSRIDQLRCLEEKKGHEENHRHKLMAEREALENLEKNYEGYDLSVKRLMQDLKRDPASSSAAQGVLGVLAEKIQVSKGYETAIEVALGRGAQNVICDNEKTAKGLIERLKAKQLGRVTFLPLSLVGKSQGNASQLEGLQGFVGMADSLVEAPEAIQPAVRHLIGRTAVFEAYDEAVEAFRRTGGKWRLVTKAGEVFSPSGSITGGSRQQSGGVLARKGKISLLKEQIKARSESLKTLDQDLASLKAQVEGEDLVRQELAAEVTAVDTEIAAFEFKETALTEDQKRLQDRIERLDKERDEQSDHVLRIREENAALEKDIEGWKASSSELESVVMAQEARRIELRTAYEVLSEQLSGIRVDTATQEQSLSSITKELRRVEETRLRSVDRAELAASRLKQLEADRRETVRLKAESFEKKIELRVLLQKLEAERAEIASQREAGRVELTALRQSVTQKSEVLEMQREALHRVEMQRERYLLERASLLTQLYDKYEIDLEEARQKPLEVDLSTAQTQTKALRSKLKALGDVNVSAIKEYEEVSERYSFMKGQMDDLIQGEQALKKVIRELDHAMKAQFRDSFALIGEAFQRTFKRLFSGGTAQVRLSDPSDPLESDIEIYVQPPGKKLQHLHLLSGGEKALTAIALLFAILEVKPAPFCVLDEIEAALDDVNVDRFALYLKDVSEKAQFVVITHRKGTMEIADALYGVTMEEYGVSRVVSVKLEEIAVS